MVFAIIAPTPNGPVEVCGGGRYDGLARVFGSDLDDRGVGFAFGLERLSEVLESQGRRPKIPQADSVLLISNEIESFPVCTRLANQLRELGVRTILEAGLSGRTLTERAAEVRTRRVIEVSGIRDEDLHTLHELNEGSTRRMTSGELVRFLVSPAGNFKP